MKAARQARLLVGVGEGCGSWWRRSVAVEQALNAAVGDIFGGGLNHVDGRGDHARTRQRVNQGHDFGVLCLKGILVAPAVVIVV